MTPHSRTPQLRDRRFVRVRRLAQTILLGSGVISAVLVGYLASVTKPFVKAPVAPRTVTTTSIPVVTPSSGSTSSVYTPPTTAPVTSTTVCTTSPSGTLTCY